MWIYQNFLKGYIKIKLKWKIFINKMQKASYIAYVKGFLRVVILKGYFKTNELQSVHSTFVGFFSWVPTLIFSREQKFSCPQ